MGTHFWAQDFPPSASSCLAHCAPRNKGESSVKACAVPAAWQGMDPLSDPWLDQAGPNLISSKAKVLKLSINWTSHNCPKESSSNVNCIHISKYTQQS